MGKSPCVTRTQVLPLTASVSDSINDLVCRLFRNIEDIQKLSELGVLFLLFEMGLELSLDRLKASSAVAIQLESL